MKTWTIEVPWLATFTISNSTTLEICEEEILDHFEVDSLDEISQEDIDDYIRTCADDVDMPRQMLADQFYEEVRNNRSDFEVLVDDIEIKVEIVEEAAE